MPKRKNEDTNYAILLKKVEMLEEEIDRNRKQSRANEVKRRRVRVISSSSSASSVPPLLQESSPDRLSQHNDSIPACAEYCSEERAPPSADADQAMPISDEQAPSSTRDALTNEAGPSTLPKSLDDDVLELDAETCKILGVDPTVPKKIGNNIQKDVAIRFEHVATSGLSKDDRKELLDKYLVPNNCKLIAGPSLNPEVKAALSEMAIKRDKAIELKQTVMASALSSLGQAITQVMSLKDKNTDLLRLLIDTGRTMCDSLYSDTITRRNFIIFFVKKEMKESLQNTKVDSFLFGEGLAETLKAAKAIHKSAEELKIAAPNPSTSKTPGAPAPSKNLSNPPPARKAAAMLKAKDTTSYRQSQSRSPASASGQPQRR